MRLGAERPKLASGPVVQQLRDSGKSTRSPAALDGDKVLANRSQRAFLQQSFIPGCFLLLDFKSGLGGLSQGGSTSLSSDICPG